MASAVRRSASPVLERILLQQDVTEVARVTVADRAEGEPLPLAREPSSSALEKEAALLRTSDSALRAACREDFQGRHSS